MSSSYKPPKPSKFSGDGKEADPEYIGNWIKEVTDHFDLLNISDNNKKLKILQFFLDGSAKQWFNNYRVQYQTNEDKWTLAEAFKDLGEFFTSATATEDAWEKFNKISQVENGKIQPISRVAINLEKLSARLGKRITKEAKIQRFIDAMHPDLRYMVKPEISETDEFSQVVKKAERRDSEMR